MKIFLSEIAEYQLDLLLDYLEIEWSVRVRDNFMNKLENALHTIEIMPSAYPLSEKFIGLHKCVVTPQTSIYYQIQAKEIEIIAIFDNRMDL
jgi:plasmid stabilization system protein ParE